MDRLMVSVSGVRGTIGATLTPDVACAFGAAFGSQLGPGKTVVLGCDTRVSGPMVRSALVAGLLSTGVSTVNLGVVTTPGAALMAGHLHADGGVVITASHNPPAYNGIKFLQPTGTGLDAAAAEALKQRWQSGQFTYQPAAGVGHETANDSTHETHIAAVKEVVDTAAIAAKRFKVVVDSINGAGCEVTPRLLAELGCEVVHLNGEPTGQFAHEPEPIQENLQGLCGAVRSEGAQIGFAQDPDADRLVVVDEKGRFIGEEYTLALCAAFVLGHRKGKLAANLATSRMIDDIAAAAGVQVVRCPTGEANVAATMAAEGCIFGGEGNGGVIEPKVVPVRDSLVGMAYLLEYLAETGQPLSALVDAIPAYTLVKTKLPCPAGAAETVAGKVREHFGGRDGVRFNDADGLRVDFADAWVSVRASNTEPIMRIFAEAPECPRAEALVAEVRKITDEVVSGC